MGIVHKMDMIIQKTQALCNQCHCQHPSEIVRRDNAILGILYCPRGQREYEISSDADMFLEIRRRSPTDFTAKAAVKPRYLVNCIFITNACNFNCTICGTKAKAEKDDTYFLSVDEVVSRASQVKEDGGWMLQLSGGEPTLHPQLPDIINCLSHMGMHTGIASNGYLLGKDKDMAMRLKKCGLQRVHLQFDSFNTGTLEKLGRNHLDEKKSAIKNILEAKLNLALTCTVTKYNLGELNGLLAHGLESSHLVKNIGFVSAAPVGRYLLSDQDSGDREETLKELLKIGDKYDFSFDDFLPLPSYLPWGIDMHPDCGIYVVFVRTPKGIFPLNRYLDFEKLYRHMKKTGKNNNFILKYIVPILYLFKSIRKGKFIKFFKLIIGVILLKQKYSLVNVGIVNYKAGKFLDKQRIDRCASACYGSGGAIKACIHFFYENWPDETR